MDIIVLFEKFGWIGFGIYLLFKEIIPLISNYRKTKGESDRLEIENKRLEAEIDRDDLQTMVTLKKQIKELVEENRNIHREYKAEIAEINKRVRFLEDELRRYANGFGRAMRYINSKKSPGDTIPDFLLDTGELMKGQK